MMARVPRLDGLLEVAVYVDDVDRSVRFYRELFDFEIIASDERLCALGVAGRHVFLICRRGASANRLVGSHDAQGQQHVAFAVPATDLQDWEARLASQGVTIEETRQWQRGGHSVYFRDPDGHLIELVSPGVWSVY
jgi:catechol 2,3-dioxygenase-like lactoylglutathione lyase family enzyme